MPLRFNETKATQAAAHLLRLRGGKMSYLKLIKLLYFADRTAILSWGRPISTDRYVSMNHGPVLSRVLDLATDGDEPLAEQIWSTAIKPAEDFSVRLVADPGEDELSEVEIETLAAIFQQFGHMNRWKLVEIAHQLPEWHFPDGGAIPIHYRDILSKEGVSAEEIVQIESELHSLTQLDAVLA